jgi:hypothetical protein
MAKMSKNSALFGLKGMLGDQLEFREVNGETIVSIRRNKSKKKASPSQTNTRNNFKEATKFARKETKDPVKKEHYLKMAKELKLPNAYTAAIKEFMTKKSVEAKENG